MIGEECGTLGIASPFTYVCKTKVFAYVAKVKDFYQEMICLNPVGLSELKFAASRKVKQFTKLVFEKRQWDKTVGEIESTKAATEKCTKMESNVRQQYPKADKPVVKNLVKILLSKKEAGDRQKTKSVQQKRTKGYITHEDAMRMSKLKEELFPDYGFLKRCIDA